MKFISRCFVSTIAAAAILTPLLPAQAKTVTTPIITLTDISAKPLDFHLVSQVTDREYPRFSSTTIQLDDLVTPMDATITSPAGEATTHKDLSAAQSLDMLIDPHYALLSYKLNLNITYAVAGGSSWSDTSLNVYAKMDWNNNYMTSNGGHGTQDLFVFNYLGYDPDWYNPLANHREVHLQLDAAMNADSSPWDDGQVSFKINSATLTFDTMQISPVPEPDALLLMLAGLAVVGVAAKRRQKSLTA